MSLTKSISIKNVHLDYDKEDYVNPGRGWYSIFPFTIPETPDFEELKWCQKKQESLALLRFHIGAYQNSVLDDRALAVISDIFDFFRSQEKQLIVRFTYDIEGNGLLNEPQERALIEQHMRQLGPILVKNADIIFTTQGLFIGSWGEMHGSRYTGMKDVALLLKTFYEATSGKVYIALRTPRFYRELSAILRRTEGGQAMIRNLNLYNDALTYSDTDCGTYADAHGSRDSEIAFQNELCMHCLLGGEVVNTNSLNDAQNATEYFRAIHLSYLNAQYDLEVLKKWDSQEVFVGKTKWNAKEYIGCHMGYRIVMKKVRIVGMLKKTLEITLENVGFASLMQPFQLALRMNSGVYYSQTMQGMESEEKIIFSIPMDDLNAINELKKSDKVWASLLLPVSNKHIQIFDSKATESD